MGGKNWVQIPNEGCQIVVMISLFLVPIPYLVVYEYMTSHGWNPKSAFFSCFQPPYNEQIPLLLYCHLPLLQRTWRELGTTHWTKGSENRVTLMLF